MSGNNIYAVPCTTPSPRPPTRQRRQVNCETLPNLHGTSRDMDDLSDNDERTSKFLLPAH